LAGKGGVWVWAVRDNGLERILHQERGGKIPVDGEKEKKTSRETKSVKVAKPK